MSAIEALFIGGPYDGRRIVIPYGVPFYTVVEYPQLAPWSVNYSDKLECVEHHYLRQKMTGGHYLYVHEEIRPEEIVGLLIKGYQPASAQEPTRRPLDRAAWP